MQGRANQPTTHSFGIKLSVFRHLSVLFNIKIINKVKLQFSWNVWLLLATKMTTAYHLILVTSRFELNTHVWLKRLN